MTPVRTLPIRVSPQPGEAFDSWLEALMHRLDACSQDFLPALGLTLEGQRRKPPNWTIMLRHSECESVAAATGLQPEQLHEMTLARYDGVALHLNKEQRRIGLANLWGRGAGSRFCPQCLADNESRWPLWWRLGWAFACPYHRCLLVDVCPDCGRTPRLRHLWTDVPQPGHCRQPTPGAFGQRSPRRDRTPGRARAGTRCNGDYAAAHSVSFADDHPVLVAQTLLLKAIEDRVCSFGIYAEAPLATVHALPDIRAAAARFLHYATEDELATILPADLMSAYLDARAHPGGQHDQPARTAVRPGARAPAHAAVAAAGVTAAIAVLGKEDIAQAGQALRWLVQAQQRRGHIFVASTIEFRRYDTSPQWTAVQYAALEPALSPFWQIRHRTAAAAPPAAPPDAGTTSRRAARVPTACWPLWALRLAPKPGLLQQSLRPALSCLLLQSGTRLTLAEATELLGLPRINHHRSRLITAWHDSPHWPAVCTALARLADYLDNHSTPIDYQRRRGLDYTSLLPGSQWRQIGRDAGMRHGARQESAFAAPARIKLFELISGLPVQHAPPAIREGASGRLLVLERRLSCETADLVIAGLHQAGMDFLARQGCAAEPVAWQPPVELLAGLDLPGPDPETVDAAAARHLIGQERLSYWQAAQQLGTSIDVVRFLLQQPAPSGAGPIVGLSSAARLRLEIPPERLADLHNREHLSCGDIASLTGTTPHAIRRLAQEYGLALRRSATPRMLRPVLRLPDGLQWLITFAELCRCTAIKRAATSLGMERHMVGRHLSELENAVGDRLIFRAAHSRQMRLTKTGRTLLDLLDSYAPVQQRLDAPVAEQCAALLRVATRWRLDDPRYRSSAGSC